MMAEAGQTLDEITQDAVDLMAGVSRPDDKSRPRRRKGEGNRVLYGLSNGAGLIMVRICILLITIIVGLGATVGQLTLRDINDKISVVATGLNELRHDLGQMRDDVTALKIDDAATKQRLHDLTAAKD